MSPAACSIAMSPCSRHKWFPDAIQTVKLARPLGKFATDDACTTASDSGDAANFSPPKTCLHGQVLVRGFDPGRFAVAGRPAGPV